MKTNYLEYEHHDRRMRANARIAVMFLTAGLVFALLWTDSPEVEGLKALAIAAAVTNSFFNIVAVWHYIKARLAIRRS